jgi:hypothetical protein
VVDGDDTARHDAGIALFGATTVAGASRLATFPKTKRQTKCSPSWPLRASAQERNANVVPTLTTPPFELSCHRHATAPQDATHLRRKTPSEGLQAADMVREGPNVKLSGPRRQGALAAKRKIDTPRIAAQVRSSEGLGPW